MNRQQPQSGWLLAVVATVLLAQGCSGILSSEQPAKQYYMLSPLTADAAAARGEPAASPSLALSVTAIPGLDTDRILALDMDARLSHFANARWPDHLPELLSSVMQRSLEATGRFGAVRASDRGAAGDWTLQLEVRAFYGRQDTAGTTSSVDVSLAGSVSCNDATHALGLEASTPVREQRLAAIVAAHQAGLDRVTGQLIERLNGVCGPERT